MPENSEYPNAIGDIGILKAIDELIEKRNFSKAVNPLFGTVRPISELASKYVKSALVNASEQVPGVSIDEMDYHLKTYDPYYKQMSRICKDQLMHDNVDKILNGLPREACKGYLEDVAAAAKKARDTDGDMYYLSEDTLFSLAKAHSAGVPIEEPDTETAGSDDTEAQPIANPEPEAKEFVFDFDSADEGELSQADQDLDYGLKTASTQEELDAVRKKWMAANGYGGANVQVAPGKSAMDLTIEKIGATAGRKGVYDYLTPYAMAMIKTGLTPDKDGYIQKWMDYAPVSQLHELKRIKGFKRLGEFTDPHKWILPDTAANLISTLKQLPSDEDREAFVSMIVHDTVYKKQEEPFTEEEANALPRLTQIVDSVLSKRFPVMEKNLDSFEKIQSKFGVDKAKGYIDTVEKYAATHPNAYALHWLFDLWNKNQTYYWPHRSPNAIKEEEALREDLFKEFEEDWRSTHTEEEDQYKCAYADYLTAATNAKRDAYLKVMTGLGYKTEIGLKGRTPAEREKALIKLAKADPKVIEELTDLGLLVPKEGSENKGLMREKTGKEGLREIKRIQQTMDAWIDRMPLYQRPATDEQYEALAEQARDSIIAQVIRSHKYIPYNTLLKDDVVAQELARLEYPKDTEELIKNPEIQKVIGTAPTKPTPISTEQLYEMFLNKYAIPAEKEAILARYMPAIEKARERNRQIREEQQNAADGSDADMVVNNVNIDPHESRWSRVEQSKMREEKMAQDKRARVIRTESEYKHMGDMDKASGYRNRMLALFKKDPVWRLAIDPDQLKDDALHVYQNIGMSYSDKITDSLNKLRSNSRFSEDDFRTLTQSLVEGIYGKNVGPKIVMEKASDPRAIAEQGVRITPYLSGSTRIGLILASYAGAKCGEIGLARRACEDAIQDLNTMIMSALMRESDKSIEYLIFGNGDRDPKSLAEWPFAGGRNIPVSLFDSLYHESGVAINEESKAICKILGLPVNKLDEEDKNGSKQSIGLKWVQYSAIKDLDKELAHKILMFKIAQSYGMLSSRLIAYKLASNILESTQIGKDESIYRVYNNYLQKGDPRALSIIEEYAQGLAGISSAFGTKADYIDVQAKGKAIDGFLETYSGGSSEDTFKEILDLDNLPDFIKKELVPSGQRHSMLPTRAGWESQYTAGDMLAEAYAMVDTLAKRRMEKQSEFDDAWSKSFKLHTPKGMTVEQAMSDAAKNAADFTKYTKIQKPGEWAKYKDQYKALQKTKDNLRKWEGQKTLAKSVWKQAVLTCTTSTNASTVAKEVADNSQKEILRQTSRYLKDKWTGKDVKDTMESLRNHFAARSFSEISNEEYGQALAYAYSRGAYPLVTPSKNIRQMFAHVNQCKSERAELTDDYIKKAVETDVDNFKNFRAALPKDLDGYPALDFIDLLSEWKAGDGRYAPRMRFNPLTDMLRSSLKGRTLEKRSYLEKKRIAKNGEQYTIRRDMWVVRYPGASRDTVLMSDRYKDTAKGSTLVSREIFDPSTSGTLVEDNRSPYRDLCVSDLIYAQNMAHKDETTGELRPYERYYDRTYDPELKDQDFVAAGKGYLGGLGDYFGDLSSNSEPYIQINRFSFGKKGCIVHTAEGADLTFKAALESKKKALDRQAEHLETMIEQMRAEEDYELNSEMSTGINMMGLAGTIDMIDRMKTLLENIAPDKVVHILGGIANVERFFEIRAGIKEIWDSAEDSHQVKLDKTERLISALPAGTTGFKMADLMEKSNY